MIPSSRLFARSLLLLPLLALSSACGGSNGASSNSTPDGGSASPDGSDAVDSAGGGSTRDSGASLTEAGASGNKDSGGSTADSGAHREDGGSSKDAATDGPFADVVSCVPSCGTAKCGDDGCGGSCGMCSGVDWCGGGGTPGQCGTSATLPPYPGTTITQVDTGPAIGLLVSGDEKHVLVQRTAEAQGSNGYITGGFAVVTVGPTGTGSAVELTSAAAFDDGSPRAGFTSDSGGFYYLDVATSPVELVVASADGTSLHPISAAGFQAASLAGTTLVYLLDPNESGSGEVWAVTLPGGTPHNLVTAGAIYYPSVTLNASGSAALVTDQALKTYELVQTATGATTTIGAGQTVSGAAFSPDGARLTYWIDGTGGVSALHVIGADGTGDALLGASIGSTPAFSPDGSHVAYGVGTTSGLTSVTVHDFAGSPDVTLTLSPTPVRTWGIVAFSRDGKDVLVTSVEETIAAAPAAGSAAFVELATSVSQSEGASWSVPPVALCAIASGEAAVLLSGRAVSVLPLAGGAAAMLSVPVDDLPFYEPVASTPRLLAFTSTGVSQSGVPGSLALFPTAGTGASTPLPGAVFPAFTLEQDWQIGAIGWQGEEGGHGQVAEPFTWGWFGSEVVYETDRNSTTGGFDVVAATDDVGTVGVIAPGALVWAVRSVGTPTTTFFTRPAQNGVWMTSMPQTPGR